MEEKLETAAQPARLTARGAQTRSRIISVSADLMRVRGASGTTLDDVVHAGGVSKSQLYSHFADKTALVRAVVEYIGELKVGGERERLNNVDSFAGLKRWRDGLIANNALEHGRYGCALGSLANEVSDHDAVARVQLQVLFTAWGELFEDVLHRFQSKGLIPVDADVVQLATGLLAAVQGGYLLAQTARDVAPMAAAVDASLAHLQLLSSTVTKH